MHRLIVEGWRSVPHSYAIVNHYQCLELLRRPDVELFHVDAPYASEVWRKTPGLFDATAEAAVDSIPPPKEIQPDALLRISSPLNFSPVPAGRLFVFGTAEAQCVPPTFIRGTKSLVQALQENPGAQIITPSSWSRRGFINSGAAPEQVHVVPHGVDVALYQPLPEDQRQSLRRQNNYSGFVFLNVGAMTPNKGITQLLKATALVAQSHPEVRLVLKGTDALYRSNAFLLATVKQLTESERNMLQPRLHYLGGIFTAADMARMYQSADAYVAPYRAEGFNLPVLEAAASGLPVICTAGGPTDDFVRDDFALRIPSAEEPRTLSDGSAGRVLVPDFDALVQHMRDVIEQPQISVRARDAGPRFARENFTWKHAVDRLVQVIFPPPPV